jgi:hypothetical protein
LIHVTLLGKTACFDRAQASIESKRGSDHGRGRGNHRVARIQSAPGRGDGRRAKTTALTSLVSTQGHEAWTSEVFVMQTIRWLFVGLSLVMTPCCSKNPTFTPPAHAEHAVAAKPDAGRARAHLQEHVTYPATRSQVLDACASTKEFSDAEKQWFSDNLPDGQYASARDVIGALKLDVDCSAPVAVTCND